MLLVLEELTMIDLQALIRAALLEQCAAVERSINADFERTLWNYALTRVAS